MIYNNLEYPTIILSTKYHKHLGRLITVDENSINLNLNMASADEISFDVYRKIDSTEEPLWDQIIDFKYIFVPEYATYFSIEVSVDDSDSTVKHVTGKSACEFELSKRILYDLEINTESDILQDDYVVTVLYNPENPRGSLLHRVLADKCPDYSIGHVDTHLWNIQRTFSANGQDVYAFLTGTVAEEIECLFTFDSVNRVINVYDIKSVCDSCGYRGEMAMVCPECGSSDYHNTYGETTNIYISAENYAEQITKSGNTDNVFNCLRLSGGDDNITTALMYINPNGSRYIYNFNEETLADMPAELVAKINSYNALYNSVKDKYAEVSEDYYEAIDQKAYLEHTMMPDIPTPATSAAEQAAALPQKFANFGNIAVANAQSISESSANLAVKGMAQVLVDTRYNVKATGTIASISGSTNKRWTGTVEIVNKGDEDDKATTSSFSVVITGTEYENYLYQRILKQLDRDDSMFYDLFEIPYTQADTTFKNELKRYCKARLESFHNSYETCLNVLIEAGVPDRNSKFYDINLYNDMYKPYYSRLQSIEAEMKRRDNEIKVQDNRITSDRNTINGYHDQLDFQKYLGEELWTIYSHYRLESEYTNSNYISDGLENNEIFAKAKELFDVAEQEVKKASAEQYTLTASMNNLLQDKAFADHVDKIQLGNWLTLLSDDSLWYLRLIGIQIDFGSLEQITVSFSDAVRVNNTINDAKSVLSQVANMASSYDTVKHQASQGDNANSNVVDWLQYGLNSALVNIKNNNQEEITYNNNGLLIRSYDDTTDTYSPKQFKLTHNVFAFTDDAWQNCKMAIGEMNFPYFNTTSGKIATTSGYGVTADFVNAGHIYASDIVSGHIYSDNCEITSGNVTKGSHINLTDGTFSMAAGKLKASYSGSTYTLDIEGNVTMTGGSLTVKDSSNNNLLKADVTNKTVTIGGFTVKSNAIYNGTSSNTSTTAGVYLGTDGIRNYKDSTHYVDIKNGVLTANAVSVSGSITGSTISGGSISGTTINNGSGTFSVDTSGNVTANSLTSSNATITGGSLDLTATSTSVAKVTVSSPGAWGNYTNKMSSCNLVCKCVEYNKNLYSLTASYSATTPSQPFGALQLYNYEGTMKIYLRGDTGNISCTTINSGTPITSSNIGSQSVNNSVKVNGNRIVSGSSVVTPNGSSVALISAATINSLLGVSDSGAGNTAVYVANGDGGANGTHIEGCTFMGSDSTWYAVFNGSTSSAIRINWTVVYWG